MGIAEELEKLNDLKQRGAISEDEFETAKKSILEGKPAATGNAGSLLNGISDDAGMWGMLIHLSQFASFVIPMAGLIVPIILWQIKKDDSPIIDQHGRVVANWIISVLIYGIISGMLCLVFIGFPLVLALVIAGIAFPIIGGIKANNGEVWPYPLSISFFPVDEV